MNPNIESIVSAWNIPPGHGHRKFANFLVEKLQPSVTVDLGVDLGYSMFCFAENNLGHVYGIDSFMGDANTGPRDTYEQVMQFKSANNFNNVTVIKGMFDEVALTWDKQIDILHIDGLHTYEAVSNDFNTWGRYVKPSGVILMHDVCSFDGVKQFFNELRWPKLWFEESFGLGLASSNLTLLEDIKLNFPTVKSGTIT